MTHLTTYRVVLTLLLIAWLLGLTDHAQAAKKQLHGSNRFNVLFIAVDDLRPELGCYGVDYVSTPNIDRLAKGGVVFKQHFVAVPTCGASRHALLTGRSPLTSGVRGGNNSLYKLKQEKQPAAQTMPELFNRSGYRTVLIGKISHTADGKITSYNGKGDKRPELPHAWDDFATPYGPWKRGWGVFFAYADGKHREDGGGNKDLLEFKVEKDTDLPDGLMAQAAIAKLKELGQQDQRFFMGLGFYKPHLPFVAPKQDWDAVAKWPVPPPAFRQGIESQYANRGSGEFYKYTMTWEKSRPLALKDAQAARRAYLACVRYTDRQIGKVLDALEAEGLAENTVVVLWGDHGWFLGEGAQWGKHSPLEGALHSPLIIKAPSITAPGTSLSVASTIDIYPTLVDLCNPNFQKTTHPLDGVSLLPVITGEKSSVRDVSVSTWGKATSYRTKSMRLIFRNKDGEKTDMELYNLKNEDGAYVDLAKTKPELLRGVLEQVSLWEAQAAEHQRATQP